MILLLGSFSQPGEAAFIHFNFFIHGCSISQDWLLLAWDVCAEFCNAGSSYEKRRPFYKSAATCGKQCPEKIDFLQTFIIIKKSVRHKALPSSMIVGFDLHCPRLFF